MSMRYDAKQFRTHESGLGYDASYTGHSCHTDSDPFEAASDDSDSSAAPPRRCRASQKSSRSRHNKLRTLNRWTTEEHDKLAYLVQKWGSEKNWAKVAEEMPGRTGKQCRERWLNHMKPGIVKGNWSTEEEFLLAQCHALVGSHWSKMTKRLPGRTENSIKNFWNATLRSKAPNKKRGMLWTYMQLHDPKSEDNTNALMATVNRLHETRELPPQLLAQLDAQLLDNRTWKAIHKAEKEYLESVGGELHHLALPHPMMGAVAAPMHGYGAGAGTTGPSPLAAAIPHHHHHGYIGHQLVADGTYAPSNGVNMAGGMDGNQYGLSEMPGAVSSGIPGVPMGLDHYMLTAQDPLLSCIPDTLDQDSYRVLTNGAQQQNTYQHGCPAPDDSNTAQVGPDGFGGLSASAHAGLQVEPLPSDGLVGHYDPVLQQQPQHQQADISCSMPAAAPTEHPTSMGLLSMPANSSTMLPCVDPSTLPDESCVVKLESRSHSQSGGMYESLPRALNSDEQQQQQHQSLYSHPHMQQVSSHVPAANQTTSMQFSNKPAGGHGPHCSCGPCSNSRRLHGLHSPGARRTARQNSKTGSRFQQSMPSMLSAGGDSGRAAGLSACKVQQQAYVTDDHAAAVTEMYAGGSCDPGMQHNAHDGMQIMPGYNSAGSEQYGDHTADVMDRPCSAAGQPQCVQIKQEDIPLDCQREATQKALADWAAAAGDLGHQAMEGPAALLDVAQPQTMHAGLASDGSEQVMVASHYGASDGMYWHGSQAHTHVDPQTYHQQQQQQVASEPHSEMLPPQQQHVSSSEALDTAEAMHQHHKNLVLTDLTVPRFPSDALTGLILSPLGLLSPLSGLMMPTSTRPFRLPSFGQITMMRPSINGGEWDWEALLSSDMSLTARNTPVAAAAGGGGVGTNGTLNPTVQHGDGATAAAAAGAGAKVGAKRPRVSFSSMDDDASLLIDMQPAKVMRNTDCSMTSAANAGGVFVRQFIKHC